MGNIRFFSARATSQMESLVGLLQLHISGRRQLTGSWEIYNHPVPTESYQWPSELKGYMGYGRMPLQHF